MGINLLVEEESGGNVRKYLIIFLLITLILSIGYYYNFRRNLELQLAGLATEYARSFSLEEGQASLNQELQPPLPSILTQVIIFGEAIATQSVQLNREQLIIKGKTRDLAKLGNYILHLTSQSWMGGLAIQYGEKNNQGSYNFQLNIHLKGYGGE